MQIPSLRKNSIRRTFVGAALLTSLLLLASLTAQVARAERPTGPELLPATTVALFRVPDVNLLRERFGQTALGRIGQEPQVRPLLMHLLGSTGQLWNEVRGDSNVQIDQLLAIPQGELCIAAIAPEEGSPTPLLIMDVGENPEVGRKVLGLLIKAAEDDGSTRRETEIAGAKVTVLEGGPSPLLICEKEGTLLIGLTQQSIADVLQRWKSGEGESLKDNERFRAIMNSVRASRDDGVQLTWFVDPIGFARGIARNNFTAQLGIASLPALGLDGLQGFGGSIAFAADEFDQITHMHLLLDNPRAGVIDLLQLTDGDMTPEAWVPNDVVSYTTVYWNVESTFKKLAILVDSFQGEGALARGVQRRLSDPLGVDFEKEIIAALSGRISHLNWIQRPVTLMSRGTLVAFKLSDPSAFELTLDKIVAKFPDRLEELPLAGKSCWVVKSRAPVSDNPNALQRPQPCFAVVDGYLMAADRLPLMERVLSGAQDPSKSLGASLEYKLIASKAQRQAGSSKPGLMTFNRPEEGLRMMYDLAVSQGTRDQLGSVAENNRMLKALHEALEQSSLPPFEVISKYLAPGGGVLYNEDTGFHYTGFTLRRK